MEHEAEQLLKHVLNTQRLSLSKHGIAPDEIEAMVAEMQAALRGQAKPRGWDLR